MYTTILKRCPDCCTEQEYTPSVNVHQKCKYCSGCLCGNFCILDAKTRQELREGWRGEGDPPAGLMVEKE